MLVDPAVHADLVAAARQNIPNHLRMECIANRWNEKGRRDFVLVQEAQDPRQSVDRAVFTLGKLISAQRASRQ